MVLLLRCCLFDMSPGPAITCSPLCIEEDISNRGFAAAQKEEERLEGGKDSAQGSQGSQGGHGHKLWYSCGWKEDALCCEPVL